MFVRDATMSAALRLGSRDGQSRPLTAGEEEP